MIKKRRNLLMVILLAVLAVVILSIVILSLNRKNVGEGTYSGSFYTYGIRSDDDYQCVIPKVEIVGSEEHYAITVSVSTRLGSASGMDAVVLNEGGMTVEIPKKEIGKRITFDMGTSIQSQDKMYVELKYVSEDSIDFKYAYSKEDLVKAEIYTLIRME